MSIPLVPLVDRSLLSFFQSEVCGRTAGLNESCAKKLQVVDFTVDPSQNARMPFYVQRHDLIFVRGCENFIPALGYPFCLALPGSCLAMS